MDLSPLDSNQQEDLAQDSLNSLLDLVKSLHNLVALVKIQQVASVKIHLNLLDSVKLILSPPQDLEIQEVHLDLSPSPEEASLVAKVVDSSQVAT